MQNNELEHLRALLKEAQLNQQKSLALQSVELRLLNADDFYDICGILVCDYRRQFNLLSVTLTLIDRGEQLQKYLQKLSAKSSDYPYSDIENEVFFENDYQNIERMRTLFAAPVLGKVKVEHRQFLGQHYSDAESVAILPLAQRGELIGIIAFGSVDPTRFSADMSTDFLDRLALTVTICIQNSVHIERLKMMGMVDYLTYLYNQNYFGQRFVEEVKRAQRSGERLSCMLFSVDGLAQLRERRGHTAAELAIMHTAKLLQSALRETDICARIADFEFGVILPETDDVGVVEVAERLVECFRASPCELNHSSQLPLRISAGVVSVDVHEIIAEAQVIATSMQTQADKARLMVCKKGGDGYELFLD